MFDFLQQMFRLPLDLFNASLDLMRRTWQETQKATGMALQTATQGTTAVLQTTAATGAAAARTLTEPQTAIPSRREAWPMNGDLGGNDLKYVSWAILFTKRDYETTLKRNDGELVDYPTNPASFGGMKIAELIVEMHRPGYQWPVGGTPYPPIPPEDQRYITFVYTVERRLEREAAEYEKRQTKALESISRKLG